MHVDVDFSEAGECLVVELVEWYQEWGRDGKFICGGTATRVAEV